MLNALKRFRAEEDGAITVEWVVLTSGVIFLGLMVLSIVQVGATDLATKVSNDLSSM